MVVGGLPENCCDTRNCGVLSEDQALTLYRWRCTGGEQHLPSKKEAHLEGRCWRDMDLVERGPGMSSDRASPSLLKLPEISVQLSLWPSFLPYLVDAPLEDVGLRAGPSLCHFYNSP